LGTPLACAGALLHVLNHALTKSLMFFGAGDIVNYYRTHNMRAIRGVLKALPFTGIFMFLGMFALMGFPPFSIFVSELMIIAAAFGKGAYFVGATLLLVLAVIFGAFMYYFGNMFFGNLPKGLKRCGEPLSGKLTFLFLGLLICVSGAGMLLIKGEWVWMVRKLFFI
jgi:hydrogenase-4 component F